MKNKLFLVSLACGFLSLIAVSCIDDKGNYDYQSPGEVMPVVITSSVYDTIIRPNAVLRIEPEIASTDDANYAYSWYVIEQGQTVGKAKKTVLSDKRVLDTLIPLAIGKYYFYLEVRHKTNNLYVRDEATLEIRSSDLGIGWYVLKDTDDKTNFDYINAAGVHFENVLPAAEQLEGTAVQMAYQTAQYYHPVIDEVSGTTTISILPAYHLLSSRDIRTFNAHDLTMLKGYEDQFYGVPSGCRPQTIGLPGSRYTWSLSQGDQFLLNDGRVNVITGGMTNVGKYTEKVGDYSMHKDIIVPLIAGDAPCIWCFDTLTSTFYAVPAYGPSIQPLEYEAMDDMWGTGISPQNMDYTLENLLFVNDIYVHIEAVAIMKKKGTEDYYYVPLYLRGMYGGMGGHGNSNFPFAGFAKIPAGSKLPQATLKAAHNTTAFVYFVADNQLMVYYNTPQPEEVLKTFPAGETISYIQSFYGYNPEQIPYQYVAVLTESAAGWKLYVYNAPNPGLPNLDATPVGVYQGTGNARYVMYRPH